MFARLILAVLLAAFAVPALANGPCHDTAPTMAAMHHAGEHMPRNDDRATVPHICIGCIPPASLAARGLGAPMVSAGMARRILVSVFDPGSGMPPAVPPPRRKA